MRKKIVVTAVIVLISAIGLFFSWTGFLWKKFSGGYAGSYPNAQTWSLNINEDDLIKIIKEVKNEHPELQPPNISDTTSPRHDYWYDFEFYYEDTNEDVITWVRQNPNNSNTTLGLVALATHMDSTTPIPEIKSDRKEINSDYGYFANRREISKFEDKILKLIREKIAARK